MIKAHKIRLNPTPEQANYFARAAGVARFVWNWALAEWDRQYAAGEHSTAFKLKKQFNEIRREQFPWTWEVTKNASDQPFLDLGKAFTAFFFFPSSKTCHCCGWKWQNMELSDRIFLCQNPQCAYYQVPQDRDHNAALCILGEALRLIGLIDQVVTDLGSGDDVNSAVDLT
jgi:transposase